MNTLPATTTGKPNRAAHREPTTTFARPHQSFYTRNDALILGGGAVALVLIVWELAWSAELIDPLFFSGPSAIVERFAETLRTGELAEAFAASGTNFVLGYAIAALIAVPVGILLGWYRTWRLIMEPFLNGFYATPRVALIPLIVMILGLGTSSKVFIVFLSAIFPILINTVIGVRTTDPALLKAARSFCASQREIFITVVAPSTVPFILAGLRQGVAHGLIGVVVGELFIGGTGIGSMVVDAGTEFETDLLFVGVLIIATAGILLSYALEKVERRFNKWRPDAG